MDWGKDRSHHWYALPLSQLQRRATCAVKLIDVAESIFTLSAGILFDSKIVSVPFGFDFPMVNQILAVEIRWKDKLMLHKAFQRKVRSRVYMVF